MLGGFGRSSSSAVLGFGRSSSSATVVVPVLLPDEREQFEALETVVVGERGDPHFDIEWSPEVVLNTLLSDESRFSEHWHLKIQDALEGEVGTWQYEGGRHRRMVTFRQKIDSALSPVKSSKCIWTQWYILDSREGLSFELKSDLLDVPFGDAWSLYWRWVFRPADVGHGSRVVLSTQTVFHKYLLWKGKVEGEAMRAARELAPVIEEMIRAFMLEHQPASMGRKLTRLTRALPEMGVPEVGRSEEEAGTAGDEPATNFADVKSPATPAMSPRPSTPPRPATIDSIRMRKFSTVEQAVLDVLFDESTLLEQAAPTA
jgi:hypothetical protein